MQRRAVALIWLAGCTPAMSHRPTVEEAGGHAHVGKPQAPVDVTATVGERGALVHLVFNARADDVQVDIQGVDGLAFRAPAAAVEGTFAAGATRDVRIDFDSVHSRGELTIVVNGRFNGVARSRAAAFRVGVAPHLRNADELPRDETGRPLVVMPATPRP